MSETINTPEPVQYIGTKIVLATPMTAWQDFGNHKKGEEGYRINYDDGYVSWCPKENFETHYHKADSGMTFGEAIEALQMHRWVQRTGWNGKGMYLMLVKPDVGNYLPYILMKTADDKFVPWLASQTDVLASDWRVYDGD